MDLTASAPASAADEPLDAAASARLARRLDLRVLLPLFVCYLLCYLDRSNLANAKAQVSAAVSLSESQYAFASSCFQIGYILFEVPANLVLARVRPSLWLGALVAAFGTIAALSAFARNYTELVAARIFLGIAEAGFPPGALFFLSLFYRPEEHGTRNTLFLVAGPLSNAAGAIIAYFMLSIRAGGLAGWQWLFVIEGLPALLMGLVLAAALPDSPATARFLSEEERELAARRVPVAAIAAGGHHGGGHGSWRDALALLRSPVVASFCLLNVSTNIASYGIGAFLPAIVAELGYAQLEANLRTAPVYVFMAVFNIAAATVADRLAERGWVVVGCLAGSAGGMMLLALSIVLKWPLTARYALTFLVVFYSATSPLQLAWLQRAYRSRVEAAVGPALVLTIGSLGAFVGPLVYGNTASGSGADASYVSGHFAMFGVFAFGALLATAMRLSFYERPLDRRLVVRPTVSRMAFGCCGAPDGNGEEEGAGIGEEDSLLAQKRGPLVAATTSLVSKVKAQQFL